MRELELRHIPRPVEFRATGTGLGILTGYAAVFNRYSQNLGGFVEQVDPGAFTKTLGDSVPVVARFNHEDNFLLGTTAAQTLRLFVDGTGLGYEVDLPDTTAGRDVKVLAERGDLQHSSFAFRTLTDDWGFTPEGFPLRTLLGVQLVDVAPVTNPAYRDTTTGLRSLAERLHIGMDQVKEAAEKEDLRSLLMMPAVGDRIVIDPDSVHDPAHTTGTIAEIGTTAYGVVMDGMSEMGIHRWYTADEFDFEGNPDSGADATRKKRKPASMGGMTMDGMGNEQNSAPKDSGAHGDGTEDKSGQVDNHPLLSLRKRQLEELSWR